MKILRARPGLLPLALLIIISGIILIRAQHSGAMTTLVIVATALVLIVALGSEIRAYRRNHADDSQQ